MRKGGPLAYSVATGLAVCAGRNLCNAARKLAARPVQRRNNAALWTLARHWLGLRPIRSITCIDVGGEGAGSQALSRVMARSFAAACALPYVHAPFAEIDRAERPMDDWVAAWESLFNFGEGKGPGMPGPHSIEGIDDAFDFATLFACDGYTAGFLRRLVPWMAAERDDLRARYRPPVGVPDLRGSPPDRVTIAVHVRRGEVSPTSHASLWTQPDAIARTVGELRDLMTRAGRAHRFVLVTQGTPGELAGIFDAHDMILADADPLVSFAALIEADMLVMAKSSYSYMAAMISDGIVLYRPNFYPPMPDWLHMSDDGAIDRPGLERRLAIATGTGAA